jgi:hypothetical protein
MHNIPVIPGRRGDLIFTSSAILFSLSIAEDGVAMSLPLKMRSALLIAALLLSGDTLC